MEEFKKIIKKIDFKVSTDEEEFVTHKVNKIQINDSTPPYNYDFETTLNKQVENLEQKLDLLDANQTIILTDVSRANQSNKRLIDEQQMLKQSLDEYKQFYLDLHKTLAQTTSSMLALEERLINQEKTSYDGTLLWSLTSVRQKICESLASRQKSFFSPVFYTSRDGYRLTCKIYLNGDGQAFNEFVSIYLVILRGNFDALLSWPFKQKCSFVLVDKQDAKRSVCDSFKPDPNSVGSFKRPISEMNVPAGLPFFVPLNTFNGTDVDFFNDDTMFIKVNVDTSDLNRF